MSLRLDLQERTFKIKKAQARCVYSTSLVGMEIDMSLSCTVEAGEAGAQRNSQAKACYDSMAHYQPQAQRTAAAAHMDGGGARGDETTAARLPPPRSIRRNPPCPCVRHACV